MRAEFLIERVDDVGNLEILGLGDGGGEIGPERPHHRTPIGIAARDVVELFLKPGGEAGIDVFLEKTHQEGGDQTTAVFRDKAALVDFDVVAVLQHRDDRGIGGRPADAEFFHLLDQRGF